MDAAVTDLGLPPWGDGPVPLDDTGNGPKDTGNTQPDVPASFDDTPVSTPDTGTTDDTGSAPEDIPDPQDTGSLVDAGVRDTGVRDTGVRDTGTADVPRTDAGGTCAAPRRLCGGTCVDTTTNPAHCGACGTACAAPTPNCVAGRCAAPGCGMGASDCDGNMANGCEFTHAGTATCAAAPNLGTWCGDTGCGFLCPSTRSRVVATQTGRTSAWFRGRTTECSICPAEIEVTFTLTVPAGIDYDLYVYDACGRTPIGSSALLSGQTDRVTIRRGGSAGGDDFNWWVEVRYYNGSACSPWSLTVNTRSNSASSC